MNRILLVFALVVISPAVFAEEGNIESLDWLVGHWVGDGFGGRSEEIWSPPKDGVMIGLFRHHKANGDLNFYEFLEIRADGLRLKHFNPDMTGWEEKDDFLTFPFREQGENFIQFGGLRFDRVDDNAMRISLRMKTRDGEHTEVFNMRRPGE